jgi:hypothetical protein
LIRSIISQKRLTRQLDIQYRILITHVETTAGPVADEMTTPRIPAALQQQELLPRVHIVDTGFLDAALEIFAVDVLVLVYAAKLLT